MCCAKSKSTKYVSSKLYLICEVIEPRKISAIRGDFFFVLLKICTIRIVFMEGKRR